ncbi:MAG: hypothetical protein MUP44_08825 [Anaerolineales bacterium]|nr:hypothetical protein [Anaerolineales bacterium]
MSLSRDNSPHLHEHLSRVLAIVDDPTFLDQVKLSAQHMQLVVGCSRDAAVQLLVGLMHAQILETNLDLVYTKMSEGPKI